MTRKQPKKPEIYYCVRPQARKRRKSGRETKRTAFAFDWTSGKKNGYDITCPCQNLHWPSKKHSPTLQNKFFGRLEFKQGRGKSPSTYLGARYYYDTKQCFELGRFPFFKVNSEIHSFKCKTG